MSKIIGRVACGMVALGVALGVAGCAEEPPSAAQAAQTGPTGAVATKPNVVFVLVDDLSTDLLKYMPNTRELAADGTSFSKYIVSDSLCCPSRSSTFTGQLPHNTGVFTNTGTDGGYETFVKKGNPKKSYAIALQGAGYRTAMYGKYMNGYQTQTSGVPKGWDDWAVADNGYPEFNYKLNENGTITQHGSAPEDYLTDVLEKKASAFIDKAVSEQKPFALELATFTPHAPSTPAPRDKGKFAGRRMPRVSSFDKANANAPSWLRKATKLTDAELKAIDRKYAKRARSVISVDDTIGRLRAQLVARGIAESTYVVFSSDNGFHLGQHQLQGGKQTAFDHDVRVPLIVAGPKVRRGAIAGALAQNTDIAPTFRAIAGLPPRAADDGRSLLPVLRNAATPADWRDAAVIEHHGADFLAGDPDAQPTKAGNPSTYTAIRTQNETYVEYRTGEREYYDDVKDPQQRVNTYEKLGPVTKQRLHAKVVELRDCDGAKECATR